MFTCGRGKGWREGVGGGGGRNKERMDGEEGRREKGGVKRGVREIERGRRDGG